MKSSIEQQEKQLRKRYHALATALGMSDEERRAMLRYNFQVESSADLDAHQLIDLVHTLEVRLDDKSNTWRKRVMASIGGWLQRIGKALPDPVANTRYIKHIACRVVGVDNFNDIPVSRLRNLYNEFLNKQRDAQASERVADEELLKTFNEMQQFGNVAQA